MSNSDWDSPSEGVDYGPQKTKRHIEAKKPPDDSEDETPTRDKAVRPTTKPRKNAMLDQTSRQTKPHSGPITFIDRSLDPDRARETPKPPYDFKGAMELDDRGTSKGKYGHQESPKRGNSYDPRPESPGLASWDDSDEEAKTLADLRAGMKKGTSSREERQLPPLFDTSNETNMFADQDDSDQKFQAEVSPEVKGMSKHSSLRGLGDRIEKGLKKGLQKGLSCLLKTNLP
ncbi:PREDICTED: uncharacterized protein LOC106813674 isoform X3 [Priapulus caudatus]|uniref:Uncharacterized protein LOC106813674 isoform X3 n=1 Tax=Priapulus caudatus TaxID=37621 RepID=A0ABM1EME1_PRICU|nr:PREDICTED: uncharacterized protein LOC106813674 isoform X3 [Priapulus caudatus]